VITADAGELHIIVERIALPIRDDAMPQQALEAFQTVRNWPSWIDGNHLDAEFLCLGPSS
jgi:hypothetical protein